MQLRWHCCRTAKKKTPWPWLAASLTKFSGFLQSFLEQEEKLEMFSEPFLAWEATACQGKCKSLKTLQAGKSRVTTWYLAIDMVMIIIKNHFQKKNMHSLHLSLYEIIWPGSTCTNSGNLVGVLQWGLLAWWSHFDWNNFFVWQFPTSFVWFAVLNNFLIPLD